MAFKSSRLVMKSEYVMGYTDVDQVKRFAFAKDSEEGDLNREECGRDFVE